jgi:hypothetical protein
MLSGVIMYIYPAVVRTISVILKCVRGGHARRRGKRWGDPETRNHEKARKPRKSPFVPFAPLRVIRVSNAPPLPQPPPPSTHTTHTPARQSAGPWPRLSVGELLVPANSSPPPPRFKRMNRSAWFRANGSQSEWLGRSINNGQDYLSSLGNSGRLSKNVFPISFHRASNSLIALLRLSSKSLIRLTVDL